MKMKRFSALALMTLLLCLPVWAMAAITVTNANGAPVAAGADTYQYVDGHPRYYYFHQNDLTISGSLDGVSIKLDENVSRAAFKNVNINGCGGMAAIECEADDATLTFTGTSNTVKGNDEGCTGIFACGSLRIIADAASNPVKVIGTQGADAIGAADAMTLSGRINAEANNVAIYSDGLLTIQEGAEIEATSENGISIQTLTGMKMQGGTLTANDGILSRGDINVEGGTLTSSGGSDSICIVLMNGELNVSGNAIITAIGANGAAAMYYNNAVNPARINADGFVLRAGNNQADAVVKPAYDQLYPYLHISPAQPPVENPPVPVGKLPQTGDNSNVLLWSALACISVVGMMTLVRKRKEA